MRITEELSGVSNEFGDLGRALEEAEQRSDDMQARVSALDELQGIGVIETPGLDALESGDAIGLKTIETQLEALKKEIRVG